MLVCYAFVASAYTLLAFLGLQRPVISVRTSLLAGMGEGGQEVSSLAGETILIIKTSNTRPNTSHTRNIRQQPISAKRTLLNTLLPPLIRIIATATDIDTVGILLVQVLSHAGIALALAALQAQGGAFVGGYEELGYVDV